MSFEADVAAVEAEASALARAAADLWVRARKLQLAVEQKVPPKDRPVWVMAKNLEIGWGIEIPALTDGRNARRSKVAGVSGTDTRTVIAYDDYKQFFSCAPDQRMKVWKTP